MPVAMFEKQFRVTVSKHWSYVLPSTATRELKSVKEYDQ